MTLPTFIIIGAQRSGTTTCHYTLARHPKIYMSPWKELNYFLVADEKPQWVDAKTLSRIPLSMSGYKAIFKDAKEHHVAIGESSPSYLYAPVAKRIKQAIPNVKIVAVLRDPIGQAFSILTWWFKHAGRQPPSTEEFVDWLEDNTRSGPTGQAPLVTHGRYVNHLRPYFNLFSRENIKVMLYDDLKDNPTEFFRDLQGFLDVDYVPLPQLHLNTTGMARSRLVSNLLEAKKIARLLLPKSALRSLTGIAHRVQSANTRPAENTLNSKLHTQLTWRFYSRSILDLERLIDRDLSVWMDGPEKRAMAMDLARVVA